MPEPFDPNPPRHRTKSRPRGRARGPVRTGAELVALQEAGIPLEPTWGPTPDEVLAIRRKRAYQVIRSEIAKFRRNNPGISARDARRFVEQELANHYALPTGWTREMLYDKLADVKRVGETWEG